MRALVRPFATHNVYFPIESIVFVFVLATLGYFHILSGIKHSSFFAPSYPTNIRPAHARLQGGEWLGVTQRDWLDVVKHPQDGKKALELQQIVFKLDDKEKTVSVVVQHGDVEQSICMPGRETHEPLRVWVAAGLRSCTLSGSFRARTRSPYGDLPGCCAVAAVLRAVLSARFGETIKLSSACLA